MNPILERVQTFWQGLDPLQRRRLWIAVGAAAVVLVGVYLWASNVPYSTVMSGRSYEDVLEAAAALDRAEVPYVVHDNGSLAVPTHRLGAAKTALIAAEVYPSLADVSELGMGVPPKAQAWAFLRAREGDLARMINGIDGVAGSQVNIVPHQETLFFEESRPASASVFVKLENGAHLEDGQVRSIVKLVAGGVDGLASDNVTVADDHGELLAGGDDRIDLTSGNPGDLLKYAIQQERNLELKISRALLPVLGLGSDFSVAATVEVDTTSSQTTTNAIEVDEQAVVSEENTESMSERVAEGGVPGVDANLPERQGESTAVTKDQRTQKSQTRTNYAYPENDIHTVRPAGALKRVSVAVQVNQARVSALAGDDPAKIGQLEQQISEAVTAAVGMDVDRNDQIKVTFLPFAEPVWVDEVEAPPALASVAPFAPYTVAALALLLAFLFLVRPLVNAAVRSPRAAAGAGAQRDGAPGEGGDREEEEDDGDLAARLAALVDDFQAVDSADLNRLVDQRSSAAAQVVRLWSRE